MIPIRSSYKLLFFVICFHLLYFIVAYVTNHIYLADSSGYLHQAANLKQFSSWYAEDWNAQIKPDYFSFRPPLYALFILCIQVISTHVYTILVVQNVVSICTVWIIIQLLQKLPVSRTAIYVSVLFSLLLFPTQLVMANMVMSEVFFQFLVILLFYVALRFYESISFSYVQLMAVLLSALILTKPVALFLCLPLLLWCSFVYYKKAAVSKRSWVTMIVVILLFPMLTFFAIGLQHKHATGYFHYSSIKPVTQQRYHARFTLADKFGMEYADRWNDSCYAVYTSQPTYEKRYQAMQHMGDEVLWHYPFRFAKLYAKGVITFFLDPGRHDVFTFFNVESKSNEGIFRMSHGPDATAKIRNYIQSVNLIPLICLIGIFIWNIFVLVSFLAFVANRTAPFYLRLLVVLVVLYFALATGMLGVARYKTVVFPFLIITVAFFFDWIKTRVFFKLKRGANAG